MSLGVKVTPTTPVGSIAAMIRRKAQPRLRSHVNDIGRQGIQEVVAEVNATFNTNRPESRRRGGTKLNDPGAYAFEPSDVGLNVRGEWRVIGDNNFKAKFFSLHNGARDHQITKRGNGNLVYDPLDGASTNVKRMPRSVRWTANGAHSRGKATGIPFYERALQRVLARSRR